MSWEWQVIKNKTRAAQETRNKPKPQLGPGVCKSQQTKQLNIPKHNLGKQTPVKVNLIWNSKTIEFLARTPDRAVYHCEKKSKKIACEKSRWPTPTANREVYLTTKKPHLKVTPHFKVLLQRLFFRSALTSWTNEVYLEQTGSRAAYGRGIPPAPCRIWDDGFEKIWANVAQWGRGASFRLHLNLVAVWSYNKPIPKNCRIPLREHAESIDRGIDCFSLVCWMSSRSLFDGFYSIEFFYTQFILSMWKKQASGIKTRAGNSMVLEFKAIFWY